MCVKFTENINLTTVLSQFPHLMIMTDRSDILNY